MEIDRIGHSGTTRVRHGAMLGPTGCREQSDRVSSFILEEAHRAADIKQGAYRTTYNAGVFRNGRVADGYSPLGQCRL
jgi:hypothetical protein